MTRDATFSVNGAGTARRGWLAPSTEDWASVRQGGGTREKWKSVKKALFLLVEGRQNHVAIQRGSDQSRSRGPTLHFCRDESGVL